MMRKFDRFLSINILSLFLLFGLNSAFTTDFKRQHHNPKYLPSTTQLHESTPPPIDVIMTPSGENDDDEDVEPGKMRVSEIKAELETRGIDYSDCFDKDSLANRLKEARESGKADPSIIDKFNKAKLEETFNEEKLEVPDAVVNQAVANDGNLPGGMDPEMFKKLMGNPEVMTLLQSTKMQDAMRLMMTGGQSKLEEAMRNDPEMQDTVKKLDEILGSTK